MPVRPQTEPKMMQNRPPKVGASLKFLDFLSVFDSIYPWLFYTLRGSFVYGFLKSVRLESEKRAKLVKNAQGC